MEVGLDWYAAFDCCNNKSKMLPKRPEGFEQMSCVCERKEPQLFALVWRWRYKRVAQKVQATLTRRYTAKSSLTNRVCTHNVADNTVRKNEFEA